ncbi:MAG: hypothetical protein R2762_14130 [Bryobacteraceae bacterium]
MPLSKSFLSALVVAVLALWASLDFFQAMGRTIGDPYKVTQFLARYGPAVEMLPSKGKVGYLSDTTFDDVKGQVLYFSALYAVAPHKLVYSADAGPDMEYVLGNFSILDWQKNVDARGGDHPLETFKSFGNGLVLLRRKD